MKVKEVIEFLQTCGMDKEVLSCGPDIGGYDAVVGPVNVLHKYEDGSAIVFYSESPEHNEVYIRND